MEKCLKTKAWALSKNSSSIQSLSIGGFESIVIKMHKLNKSSKFWWVQTKNLLLVKKILKEITLEPTSVKLGWSPQKCILPQPQIWGNVSTRFVRLDKPHSRQWTHRPSPQSLASCHLITNSPFDGVNPKEVSIQFKKISKRNQACPCYD